MVDENTKKILEKYSRKLNSQLNSPLPENYSVEYQQFRAEMIPELTRYEKWAESLGNTIKLKVKEKDRIKVQNYLNIAHLNVTAAQSLTLSVIATLVIFMLTLLSATAIFFISFPDGFAALSSTDLSNLLLFIFFGVMVSMFVFYYTYNLPKKLANIWRLQASAQMVPAVLYVAVYMKHTSNLERAIRFAAQHLECPLALDFKKIFYDVEIGKFSTIKQSLDNYLETWRDYSPEFIESFHLIESSLFEPSDSRRVEILERSLQVILDGVYEKMLKYSREIRSPLTNLYMLGIILPTLGLALLPLASTLLGRVLRWPHVFLLFNIIVPFFVYYMVSEVLLKRPGGYGETQVVELHQNYGEFKSKAPWIVALIVALPLFIIGIMPFIFQSDFLTNTLNLQQDYSFDDLGLEIMKGINLFDFKIVGDKKIGPFGPFGILFSLFIPLSVVVFFSIAYSQKTKNLIKSREETKMLEEEFANSLFQLGNRLGDGLPAEIAFARVAESTKGQKTADFFYLVNTNLQQGGMSLDAAIFDKKRGAIVYYPSALISTSMKILVESVQKGLKIAAASLMSISEYIKNIDKINKRLKDLLAEIVSDMRSNMVFLAPLLAGIVVGLASMITFILNKLQNLQVGGSADSLSGFGNFQSIVSIFDVTQTIPPYFIQISIGIYIVEVIFILTGALVTVDAGKDSLKEKYELSKNLKRGMLLYLATSLISIIVLTILANVALGSLG